MRHFAYIGDHAETALYGVVFRKGEPTPIPDDKTELLRKLPGNSHFVESRDYVQPDLPCNEANATDYKDQLIAEAEKLGINADRRWGVAKLQRYIAEKTP